MRNEGCISKVIYFDKETISNILQEVNRGEKKIQSGLNSSFKSTAKLDMESKVKLDIPLWNRIKFLFTGTMSLSYIAERDSKTTITSTEISEFDMLKKRFHNMNDIQVMDIENSSTFFRVAAGYLKMLKGGIDDVDVKEFKNVMESYDGYDTYKISKDEYVRFNNTSFLSNYKRNDLLTTKMNLYCVFIGEFEKQKFDFIEQFNKMEVLIKGSNNLKTLADLYPSDYNQSDNDAQAIIDNITDNISEDTIKLYDVVYAAVSIGGTNE